MLAGKPEGSLKPLCDGVLAFASVNPDGVSGVNVANNGLTACSTPGVTAGETVRD